MAAEKKKTGHYVLNIVSILIMIIFLAPIMWAFFASLQIEGKQFTSIFQWFTPPYTLSNYPQIIFNSSVPIWLKNSIINAVISTVATVLFSSMAAYTLIFQPF